MKDDFSNLETGASCYALSNTTTILSYKSGVRTTYNQVGGRWYKTAAQNYTSVPTNTVCWSYADITALNSNAVYYPFYVLVALMLSLFVWFFVFRLISKLFRWRV